MIPSKTTLRLPIPDDCCAHARWLIADYGIDPDTVLEFMRGDIVSLCGTAQAFACRMVIETGNGPVHVPYRPFDAAAKARVGKAVKPPVR